MDECNWNVYLTALSVLVSAVGLFQIFYMVHSIYRRNKEKVLEQKLVEIKITEEQIRSLVEVRKQADRFIFKTLATHIKNMITENKEDKDKELKNIQKHIDEFDGYPFM